MPPDTPASFQADAAPAQKGIADSVGDFASEFWKQVNPVAGVKGAAQLAAHPIDTYKADASARQGIYDKAEEAFKKGNYTEGAGHLLHAFIPFVGPQLDAAANNFLQGNYAKGAGASVGMGVNMAAPELMQEGVSAVRARVATAGEKVAPDLYQSALKPSTTYSPSEVRNLVQTGIKNEIPVSEAGLSKLSDLIDGVNDNIAAEVKARSVAGSTVSKFDVASRLNDTAKKFANQVNPEADLSAVGESGNEFLRNQAPDIPLADAQSLKQGTYQQLKGRSYGELRSATIESQKALARGLKEEIVNVFPEISDLNAHESRLIGLDDALERAVNRIGNHQLVGIGTPIAAAGAKAVTGSSGVAATVGLMRGILDNPIIKSKLAIALSRKGIPPVVGMGRIQGFINALGNQVEAQQSQPATMQPAMAQ